MNLTCFPMLVILYRFQSHHADFLMLFPIFLTFYNLLKAITPGASVGEKFDVRKKPEFLGGSPDTDPETLTGAEKLFGRVVR